VNDTTNTLGTPRPRPAQLPAWQALSQAAAQGMPHLRELLQDSQRPAQMTTQAAGLTLDFSRQRITPAIFEQLIELARQSQLPEQRDAMARGERINATEQRAVLHMALRGCQAANATWPADVSEQVRTQLQRMLDLAERIRSGAAQGFDGQSITDVVTLGIGGSDLGPRMAVQALLEAGGGPVSLHFVSNPDPSALHDTLVKLQSARTLFIVSSKTFTTQETLLNATSARRWLLDAGCPEAQAGAHFIAITSQPEQALERGYTPEQTLLFWDWVGGRYSLWSAIGLPLAIAIGAEGFERFLAGAHAMDQHFLHTPLAQNLPVLLAVLGIWNRNFLKAPTQLITSYVARLAHLSAYIQQMDMESNGKRTHTDGTPVTVETGPIVWGGLGIDGQHAYYQLLHQGKHDIAVDFIGALRDTTPLPHAAEHLRFTQANALAQAQALALGRDAASTHASLRLAGLSEAQAWRLSPHRTFDGNVPSNLLWLDTLNPHSLGALVALYEHKVFCQAAIWNTHAFDQWGVELGKQMASALMVPLTPGEPLPSAHDVDASTLASLQTIRQAQVQASPQAAHASCTVLDAPAQPHTPLVAHP
jgi:glucose-6-phosphate isomerase